MLMKNKRITGMAVFIYFIALLLTLEAWGQLPATGISLNRSSTTMNRGAELQFSATLMPENANQDGIRWTVDNTGIATVNPVAGNPLQATVKAVGAGSTTLTVQTMEGHTATASIRVVVPVTGVSLANTDLELIRGESLSLSATIQPADATNKNLRWVSDDPDTVRLVEPGADSFGSWHTVTIEALEAGQARVRVETQDGNQSAGIDIDVIVLVEAVVFEDETVEMNSGDKIQPMFEILPADATNQDVWYESTEPSIATVDEDGILEAHKEGAARIILRSYQDRMIFDHMLVLVDGAEAPEDEEGMLVLTEETTGEDPAAEEGQNPGEAPPGENVPSDSVGLGARMPLIIGAVLLILLVGLVMMFRKNSFGEMKKQAMASSAYQEEPVPIAPLAVGPEEVKIPGRAVVWGLSGEFEGQGIELAENLLIIGRDATLSHVVYPSHREDISRKHVKIEFDAEKGNCWITDLSANGTYLADTEERLPHDQSVSLRSGSKFYLVEKSELFEVEF